jgi:hypothetical protein
MCETPRPIDKRQTRERKPKLKSATGDSSAAAAPPPTAACAVSRGKRSKRKRGREGDRNVQQQQQQQQQPAFEDKEYSVEKLLKYEVLEDNQVRILVKWWDHPGQDTWEPADSLPLNMVDRLMAAHSRTKRSKLSAPKVRQTRRSGSVAKGSSRDGSAGGQSASTQVMSPSAATTAVDGKLRLHSLANQAALVSFELNVSVADAVRATATSADAPDVGDQDDRAQDDDTDFHETDAQSGHAYAQPEEAHAMDEYTDCGNAGAGRLVAASARAAPKSAPVVGGMLRSALVPTQPKKVSPSRLAATTTTRAVRSPFKKKKAPQKKLGPRF